MNEYIRLFNEACARVNAAVVAMREAPDGADMLPLEASFRGAVAAAEVAQSNMERHESQSESLQRFTPRAVDNPNLLGMDPKQVRSYSILRAIAAAASGNWTGAELEREASEEIAKRIGKDPSSFYLPADIQHRDMTVGTDANGGFLVGTNLMGGSFVELQRNKMMCRKAGATVLGGIVGDAAIPRHTAAGSFYWVAESGAPSESQQTIDQIALSPKTGGAYTDLSRKLLKQSSIDAEQFVIGDLAAVSARGIDLAALHGTGANNQPTGIAATTGIGSVVGGTNGVAPEWAHVVDLETEVSIDNADEGALAYMTNAKVRGKMKKTLITATYGEDFLWDRKTPEAPVNGYPVYVTNQVSSTLTKGNQSLSSAIFFGNWNDLVIAEWGTLDIHVDPYTGATSGTVRVVVLQDVDIAVRHVGSFAAMLDALT